MHWLVYSIYQRTDAAAHREETEIDNKHCGTLQKCFAPKILGKAACWHVAPYGHIMTYYGEKNSKKANL